MVEAYNMSKLTTERVYSTELSKHFKARKDIFSPAKRLLERSNGDRGPIYADDYIDD